jgi:two-component system, NarL family, nitrate/nitrite response regulator NarL
MTAPTPITVVIVDDHPIFRDGLRRLLEAEPGFVVAGEAATPDEAVNAVHRLSPDLLLLDLAMPGGGGLAALRALTNQGLMRGRTRIILLTASIERHEQVAAAALGVRGIIMKESATALLIACMRAVVAGDSWLGTERVTDLAVAVQRRGGPRSPLPAATLTPRELDIITALVDGASNREIAERFDISRQTVKNHLSTIFEKLGVSTRLELALHVLQHNLLASQPPGSPE